MRAALVLSFCALFAACAPADRPALDDESSDAPAKDGPKSIRALGGYLSGEVHGTMLADASTAALNDEFSFVDLNVERPERAFMVRILFPVNVPDYLASASEDAGEFHGLACSGDAPGLWDVDTAADLAIADADQLSANLYRVGFVVQGERLGDVGGYVDLLLE